MNILFADDKQDTRDIFRFAFSVQGHVTSVASDGAEAVHEVEQHAFDAIVLDIEMPHMNGWEALERIRQMPQGKRIPVVMFTGYSDPAYEERSRHSGADRLVHKPLMPTQLLAILEEVVRERRISM